MGQNKKTINEKTKNKIKNKKIIVQNAGSYTDGQGINNNNGNNGTTAQKFGDTYVIKQPEQLNDNKSAGATETTKSVLKNSLNQLYYIIAVVIVIMFFVLFVVSWMDFSSYVKSEAKQEKILSANPNIFIDTTYDYQLFSYLKDASMTNEIQKIYYEQYLLSIIYKLFTFAAFIIGLQFLMFLVPKFNQLRGLPEDQNNNFSIPPIVLVIVIGFAFASGLTAFYLQIFLKTVINSLKDLDSAFRDIKKNIFANLTTNNDFLTKMVSNNIPALLSIIQTQINTNNGNATCGAATSNCDVEVQKMIFTVSLYTYYKDTIPESDPRYTTMLQIFTPSNIHTKTIDPTTYFYYKQSVYIENMYDTLKNENCGNGTPITFTDPNRESVFITNLSNTFQTLNKSLIKLQTIAEPKKHIRDYILQFAVIITFMFLVLIAIFVLIMFFPAIIANSRFFTFLKSKLGSTKTAA